LTENGFASFFQERSSKAVVLLISAGASRADAEDATQEAMIQAWQHWKSIREPAAWLRTVALRTWLKQCDMQRFMTIQLDNADRSTVLGPDLSIFATEQQQVLRLLRALPPMQRAVVALFYDGAPCDEIAELLDVAEATVRSHLRHARRALKEMMATGDLWHQRPHRSTDVHRDQL
jgi:RNA polymerase sigma factor (sigma-70 family)